jgi:hypothetical protein
MLPAQVERGHHIGSRTFLTWLSRGLDRGLTAVLPYSSVTDFVGVPSDRSSIKINLVHRKGLFVVAGLGVRFAGL